MCLMTCFYCLQIYPNADLRCGFPLQGWISCTFEALPPGESLQALVSGDFCPAMAIIQKTTYQNDAT